MVYYVAHKYGGDDLNVYRAREITRLLQLGDQKNCYVCPLLVFQDLELGDIEKDEALELRIDLLSICDALIIASDVSEGVQREIDFARLVGMEVIFIDNGHI